MRDGIYSMQQINLLRSELNAVYARVKSENTYKLMGWKTIAAWIEDSFINLSDHERSSIAEPYRQIKNISLADTDNFRKFCIGRSQRMNSIKLIATDIWLTRKDNHWSSLTEHKLHGLNEFPKAATFLEHFLFENNSEQLALTSDNFSGKYVGFYCAEVDQNGTAAQYDLEIEESSNSHILTVNLTRNEKLGSNFAMKCKAGEASSDSRYNLSGWIVLSPEDNIICYLKDINDGSNHIFYLIALNESVFDGSKVDCLVFLDRQIPSEISDAQKLLDFSSYLIDWAEKNKCNLMIFHRR